MEKGQMYWLEQAADMDKVMETRYNAIAVELLRDELEWNKHRARVMEEWKDNVEAQRQGLEKQVGEIEQHRQQIEQERDAARADLNRICGSKLWKLLNILRKIKRKLFG